MTPMTCHTFVEPIEDREIVALATKSYPMPCIIRILSKRDDVELDLYEGLVVSMSCECAFPRALPIELKGIAV